MARDSDQEGRMGNIWLEIIRTAIISVVCTALALWALRHRNRNDRNGRRSRKN